VHASADQASLGSDARRANLRGTMKASGLAQNKRIILIDDIVTTGSTLFEATRALEAAGAQIVGFLTFSETILRKIQKRTHTKQKRSNF